MAYQISKYYRNILGLDLRVSDLLRSNNAATEAKNIVFRQTGALSKRNGVQINSEIGKGSAGLVKFNNVALGTGTITEELLCTDDDLHKHTEQTFTITYTGSETAYFDLYLDDTDSKFKFDLYDDNTNVLALDLGTGEEGSPVTIANLKTNVDAVTDFSMTISDAGATPAAYATISRAKTVTSGGTSHTYYTLETIDKPGTYTTPFSSHWAIKNNSDFEIASFAQMLDVLYIANGYDDLHKYDGSRVYKAGLPQPTTPTATGGGAGDLGDLGTQTYKWKYTFEHTDAKENILTSKDSSEVSYTTAAPGESKVITMTNLTASSGYNTSTAVVNGAQAGVTTITVDSGHDLKTGDQVYIDDGVSGEIVKREVTGTTTTTITISGDAVDVADNDTLCPIKISLWRTKADGTLFYLEKEFVNDTTNSTTAYTSTNADSSLVIDKIDAVKIPGPPPSCRYIDVWRGQLVMTGNRENLNTVYYSDFDGESFPVDQSFVTEARLGGGNSGIKSLDNTLFIFKPRSVITCTGDLGTDQFQVDGMADDGVGCVAHATIKELEGRLWFLGKQGIYSVDRSGTVKQSEMIGPKFEESYTEKRAVAHYWIEKDLYLVQFPALLEDGSNDLYMDEANSFIMVYDLYRQAWYEWDTINMTGGMAEYNGDIYTQGFRKDSSDSLSKQYTYKVLDTGTKDDYADHEAAISFSYKTHWEALQEPSVFKKFLRLKVHSLDGTINDFETDKFDLNIVTQHDYKAVTVSSLTMDFSGGILGWGLTPWGQFNWGESRLEQIASKLNSRKAKSLRTVFTNSNIHENVLISGYEYEIATPYDLQIKE
jgi:hypothetical protein